MNINKALLALAMGLALAAARQAEEAAEGGVGANDVDRANPSSSEADGGEGPGNP